MRVGFIGLGMMGKGMAANLQKAGHQLVVHDLSRAAAEPFLAKGAVWANFGREVGVPMRLANLAYEELTEAMNRGWGTRNSSVGQLLQVKRAGIEPLAADPQRIAAVLDTDKLK
jgi:3-hydroxyisobutyrate dehydrogenase-like beta-hydroxyacid dehydrogenase